MYVPAPFAIDDVASMHAVIRAYPFATLVTRSGEVVDANHLPMLLDPDPAPLGRLRFHLTGGNPLARLFDGTRDALLVFTGANGYVSPDWYLSPNMVPTWNYVVVHARGVPVRVGDGALERLLDDLSATEESRLDKAPWRSDKLPRQVYDRMRSAISGFEMDIVSLEGKAKLGQNHTPGDRTAAAKALESSDRDEHRVLARWMMDPDSTFRRDGEP